jgi:hypothetical protein
MLSFYLYRRLQPYIVPPIDCISTLSSSTLIVVDAPYT